MPAIPYTPPISVSDWVLTAFKINKSVSDLSLSQSVYFFGAWCVVGQVGQQCVVGLRSVTFQCTVLFPLPIVTFYYNFFVKPLDLVEFFLFPNFTSKVSCWTPSPKLSPIPIRDSFTMRRSGVNMPWFLEFGGHLLLWSRRWLFIDTASEFIHKITKNKFVDKVSAFLHEH